MKRHYIKSILSFFTLAIVLGGALTANGQMQYRKALDFDGDGKADQTVIRFANSADPVPYNFYTRRSSDGATQAMQWGTYVPYNFDRQWAAGDYDGDGKADYAVVRPVNNRCVWHIRQSQTNTSRSVEFGICPINGSQQYFDEILPADYDGDGKTDIAVVRSNNRNSQGNPSSLTWYYLSSLTGQLGVKTVNTTYTDRQCTAIHGDYDGDGKNDFVSRCSDYGSNSAVLYDIVNSSNGARRFIQWGLAQDQSTYKTAADFNGDGKSDFLAVRYVPTGSGGNEYYFVWYILHSNDLSMRTQSFGLLSDSINRADGAFPADYDGDGKADIAVARFSRTYDNIPLNWYIQQSSNNSLRSIQWGLDTDFLIQ